MNDDAMREQAIERLLTSELAEVMASVGPRAAARWSWQPLYTAAMVLLGIGVAIGVAWLARAPRDEAQQPAFDPVAPWYEHEWPFRPGFVAALTRPGHADLAPPEVDEFVVTLRDEDSTELACVLDRPTVRRLALTWRNDQAKPNLTPKLWQRIASRSELEVLMLSGPFALPAERLRELRIAPSLRHVLLLSDAATLDAPTARALAELSHLRGITAGMIDVTAEGLEALAGIPTLDALMLSRPRIGAPALLAALPKLRHLRSLVVEAGGAIGAADLLPLATMKNLRALDISFGKLDDEALAGLPAHLELLAFAGLDCSPEGLLGLRRLTGLRTLRFRGLAAKAAGALPDLIRALPLERFDCYTKSPDAGTWQALQALPKLRVLTLRRQGQALAEVIAGARECAHLETLTLFEPQLPFPGQVAPLRDHATLRRLEIRLDDARQAEGDAVAERLAALRASVRAEVVVIRP